MRGMLNALSASDQIRHRFGAQEIIRRLLDGSGYNFLECTLHLRLENVAQSQKHRSHS